MSDLFGKNLLYGHQGFYIGSFCEHDPFGVSFGFAGHSAHESFILTHTFFQLIPVGIPVFDFRAGNSRFDGGFCHGRGNATDQTSVQRFGNDVIPAESDGRVIVCHFHVFGNGFFRQFSQCVSGGKFHLLVNTPGLYI